MMIEHMEIMVSPSKYDKTWDVLSRLVRPPRKKHNYQIVARFYSKKVAVKFASYLADCYIDDGTAARVIDEQHEALTELTKISQDVPGGYR